MKAEIKPNYPKHGKFVQIVFAANANEGHSDYLYALDEDGYVWHYMIMQHGPEQVWLKLQDDNRK